MEHHTPGSGSFSSTKGIDDVARLVVVHPCRGPHVQVVMVTGDHPLTAEAIARQVRPSFLFELKWIARWVRVSFLFELKRIARWVSVLKLCLKRCQMYLRFRLRFRLCVDECAFQAFNV